MTTYALTLTDVTVVRRSSGRRDRRRRRSDAYALDCASLALLPGEIAGVAGPVGAGKTTLLHVAAGLFAPDGGDARIYEDAATSAAARHRAGYAPEAPVFPPALTVREVLGYYARLHAPGAARRGLVHDALEGGGLERVANRRVAALGRADVQRLSLAQATLGGRRVLLLDETLAGLDPAARRDLCTRLTRLAAAGVAILLTARDLLGLERVAARVFVLRAGRIVRTGPLATLAGERVLEVILDAPPPEPPPGFRVTAAGLETPLAGRTAEAALALCHAHRLPVRASRIRVKSLEEVVLEAQDGLR